MITGTTMRVDDMGAWVARGPLPSTLLRLNRHGLMHVLVTGGTAERRAAVASAFHDESPLRRGPFVRLDCRFEEERLIAALRCWLSAIDRHSAENPLRAAERGTLFLDFIEFLGAGTQRQLLAFVRGIADGACPTWAGRLTSGIAEPLDEVAEGGKLLPTLLDCLDKVRVSLGACSAGEAA